jgi:hypothetical protein
MTDEQLVRCAQYLLHEVKTGTTMVMLPAKTAQRLADVLLTVVNRRVA